MGLVALMFTMLTVSPMKKNEMINFGNEDYEICLRRKLR